MKVRGGVTMGKAAFRRKAYRRKHLAELSRKDPKEFETAWEMRVDSWLSEIRYRAVRWTVGGSGSDRKIFDILDEAMDVLKSCAPPIRKKYASTTYDLICHECCRQLSRKVDYRLYRLSIINNKN